jgi:hypothetical protein
MACTLGRIGIVAVVAVSVPLLGVGAARRSAVRAVGVSHRGETVSTFRSVVDGVLGGANRSFWLRRRGGLLVASGGGLKSVFGRSGVRISVPGGGAVSLRLVSIGHAGAFHDLGQPDPVSARNVVRYRGRGVIALYRNGPFGLEQELRLTSRPRGGSGPLTLSLSAGGALAARRSGDGVAFVSRVGSEILHYGAPTVFDASGRRVRSSVVASSDARLQLRVWDRGARYPLRVDPLIQRRGKLVGAGEVGRAGFGFSVALSADGKTALVGGSEDSNARGAVWVFTRKGSSWRQQGSKLTARGEVGPANFGWDVALSGDGKTAVISGVGDRNGVGAAWIFVRRGARWRQQGRKLTGTGEVGAAEFGYAVALSGDGNTALVGGPDDDRSKGLTGNTGYGAAWVFTRSGTSWSQQGPKLTGRGDTPTGLFGGAVALSADAGTALIGAPNANNYRGAAWVFSRSGSSWRQQGSRLTGRGEAGSIGEFGAAVALSAHGTVALISAPGDNTDVGAVWTFVRTGSSWHQHGKKLTARGEIGHAGFGVSLALSPDAGHALIAGFNDNHYRGAAWRYTRSGHGWKQTGNKLTARDEIGTNVRFGIAVALSADGKTALIGGGLDNHKRGAVWTFTYSP